MYNPNKYLLLFIFFAFFASCSKKEEKEEISFSKTYINFTVNFYGKEEYNSLKVNVLDSMNKWVKNELSSIKMQKYALEWQIDSLLCINKNKDKLITVVLNRKSSTVSNSINYLYGVKVKREWYFFFGPTLYVDNGMQAKGNVPIVLVTPIQAQIATFSKKM